MDSFSGYNQINILPADQHKTTLICPWGTFAYKKLPFGLKNAGATFQRALSYAFHDIRHIIQPYLDDLPAHSAKHQDHPKHLREIFVHCWHYHIHLNPHKCVFGIESAGFLAKSKKSLVFAKLLCSLPSTSTPSRSDDHIPDESLFFISTLDPWYGDIIVYLQTSSFRPDFSKDARRWICHHSQPYRIIGDTLYHLDADSVLRRCLTFEEAERVLNDCHYGACGGHMSGYATAQKILRADYFWPSIFKD
eukprot:PITA_25138